MSHNCMQQEIEFYTKNADIIGQYYYRPDNMAAAHPDILFFCLFATRLLVEKKVKLAEATELKKQLLMGRALEKVLCAQADCPFSLPYQRAEFRGATKVSVSASMIIGKSVYFRLGYFGFGFFSRYRKMFGQLARASVYALMEAIYEEFRKDEAYMDMFWRAVSAIGRLEFGKELHSKNYTAVARKIYLETTRDEFPGLNKVKNSSDLSSR